ncbi:MAG: uroporphyrinogen-III synthase [Kiloniellales bacterium]
MRILVTRPLDDTEGLAIPLEARGHQVLVQPLLTIVPRVRTEPSLEGIQALLFTSANGVRIFAGLSGRRELPVFAVGEATGQVAREAGFQRVEVAGGDVVALASSVTERLDPKAGGLYHGAASVVAGDLKGTLEAADFEVVREQLYEARPADSLEPGTGDAVRAGGLDLVLFFSPRTADTFVRLIKAAGLEAGVRKIAALCLSPAVAERLKPLAWAKLLVAERPNQEALLAVLDRYESDYESDATAGDRRTAMSDDRGDRSPAESSSVPDFGASESAAEALIARFGGIRPMATKLGVAVSTVQGWKERRSIPAARVEQIRVAASDNGIALDLDELEASSQTPGAESRRAPRTAAAPAQSGSRPAGGPDAPSRLPASGAAAVRDGAAAAADRRTSGGTPRRSSGFFAGLLGGLVGTLILIAGAWLARDSWLPASFEQAAPPPAQVSALESRFAALSERLDTEATATAERLAALEAGSGGDDPQLAARLEDLSGRLAALEASEGSHATGMGELSSALAGSTQELETRLTALEQRQDALAEGARSEQTALGGDLAFVLAVLQLRDAVRASGSYEAELAALAPFAEDDPETSAALAVLAPTAANGVPSRSSLVTEFPAFARAIVAAAAGQEEQGWLGDVKRSIADLISIRPVGPIEGDSPAARVARAEQALAEGELKEAYDEIAALTGPPRTAAASWLARVSTRLDAEAAIAELSRRALGRAAAAD